MVPIVGPTWRSNIWGFPQTPQMTSSAVRGWGLSQICKTCQDKGLASPGPTHRFAACFAWEIIDVCPKLLWFHRRKETKVDRHGYQRTKLASLSKWHRTQRPPVVMTLRPSEVDALYDWLSLGNGLPTELWTATLQNAFPPERTWAVTAALDLIMDESDALLNDADAKRRLPDVMLLLNALPAEQAESELVEVLRARRDATDTLVTTENTWNSVRQKRRFQPLEPSAALVRLQQSVVPTNRHSDPFPHDCRHLAKHIFSKLDCVSSLDFKLPKSPAIVPQSPQAMLKWDYTLCFEPWRARRALGLAAMATKTPISERHEQV